MRLAPARRSVMTGAAPGPGGPPRRYTAIEMVRARQKLGRYGGCLVLALIGIPVGIVAMVVGAMALGPVAAALVFILAIALGFLYHLMQSALVLLIPSAILAGLGYAIYRQYRRPVLAAQPATAARFSEEIARLETLRRAAARDARRRVMLYVPVGLALAIAVLTLPGRGGGRFGPIGDWLVALFMLGFGIAVPWLIALSLPSDRYAKAFKRELMPLLLQRHGMLRHVEGAAPALGVLVTKGLLPRHDRASVDDAIIGTYAGYGLSLCEIALERRSGKNETTVFDGVVLALSVDTPFLGTTLVIDRNRPAPPGLSAVSLEDPRFAAVYDVYGSDQVEARAVLTPAVMERLLTMADGGDFFPPSCLVERDRVTFAVAATGTRRLFEPPSLQAHDATAQLEHLRGELALVFELLDAMIAMHAAVRPGGALPGGTGFTEAPAPPASAQPPKGSTT